VSCQRHELPSRPPITNTHLRRHLLEPSIGRLRTKIRVRQQYPAVCEKSRGLPGVVAETRLLVATALRHALHSPEAPCLRRLLSANLPWPRQTDCPRRGERSKPSMATRRHAVGRLVLWAVRWSTA